MEYKLINVRMNEIKCSFSKYEIITTKGIASCIGVLLYDDLNKKAIVGHFNSNKNDGLEIEDATRIYNELEEVSKLYQLNGDTTSYFVVPGIVGNVDRINSVVYELKKLLSKYKEIENIYANSVKINKETESLEFAFDPNYGIFATDKVYPNDDDYNLNNNKVK